jgi:hypothetical protein
MTASVSVDNWALHGPPPLDRKHNNINLKRIYLKQGYGSCKNDFQQIETHITHCIISRIHVACYNINNLHVLVNRNVRKYVLLVFVKNDMSFDTYISFAFIHVSFS